MVRLRVLRMLVCVTGGAGFIGSHVVRMLSAAQVPVRVVDDLSTGQAGNLAHLRGVDLCVGDVRDESFVREIMRGASHVLHLAGKVSVVASVRDPRDSASHNVDGFLSVLEAARKEGVTRLVYASSAAVYGVPERLPLAEDALLAPISPYGVEKVTNEQYAEMYGRLHGLSVFGLRYFNVYGPGQDPHSPYSGVVSQFVRRMEEGEVITVFGDGLQSRDFISVKDTAQATLNALSSPATGVCNVASGHATSLNDLLRALESVSGTRLTVRRESARPGDIRHSQADVARMLNLLGACSVSLSDGLADLVAAIKKGRAVAAS